jgi:phage terminase large subunit GpA-like protein
MSGLIPALKAIIRRMLQPRPIEKMWQWIDRHVVIPLIVGSTRPGPLNTGLTPHLRGLFELYWNSKTHFFTLAKSARVGGTLFSICAVLHKIEVWPGPILWVDPTRKTAMRFSRAEMQPHMKACKPVAELIIDDKKHFTTLEMILRTCIFGIVGAGSAADLGGRQAELIVINEGDKLRNDIKAEAPPGELAIVRSKQFHYTRKILWNSTPTVEEGETWQRFLAGSQHYCYLPCPCCGVKSRLTFTPEEKEVPFDLEGRVFGKDKKGKQETRIEKTISVYFKHCKEGDKYNLERVERETKFHCGNCDETFDQNSLALNEYEWRAHNLAAPIDTISAHTWAAYSPFETIGGLAKKFLLARGSLSKLHDFYNSDLGLPFKRYATALNEGDIERIIKRSPDYVLGQLPFKPELLTMTLDVQGFGFWWGIRAWGILWDVEGWPTATALIDYGSAVSWDQIEEFAGLKLTDKGERHGYTWRNEDGTEERFYVYAGLIDSGFEAQQNKKVYEFCLRHRDVFSPSKGGTRSMLRGKTVTLSPVYDDQLQLVWYDDNHFKQQLYYSLLKENRIHHYLPRNIGTDYIKQVTSERTVEKKLPNGAMILEWKVEGPDGNHLGDVEKEQETFRDQIEEQFDDIREARSNAAVEKLAKAGTNQKLSKT